MKYRLTKENIIKLRQAQIRDGVKLFQTTNYSANRRKERERALMPQVTPSVTTTFRSKLVSGIYDSVFCKGPKHHVRDSNSV